LAPLAPQPEQPRPVTRVFGSPHRSAQVPGAVLQPPVASQAAAQHWLVGPTVHAVTVSAQEHARHVPEPSHEPVHDPAKSWNDPDAQ
jgi:hypothetical protein